MKNNTISLCIISIISRAFWSVFPSNGQGFRCTSWHRKSTGLEWQAATQLFAVPFIYPNLYFPLAAVTFNFHFSFQRLLFTLWFLLLYTFYPSRLALTFHFLHVLPHGSENDLQPFTFHFSLSTFHVQPFTFHFHIWLVCTLDFHSQQSANDSRTIFDLKRPYA